MGLHGGNGLRHLGLEAKQGKGRRDGICFLACRVTYAREASVIRMPKKEFTTSCHQLQPAKQKCVIHVANNCDVDDLFHRDPVRNCLQYEKICDVRAVYISESEARHAPHRFLSSIISENYKHALRNEHSILCKELISEIATVPD